MGKTVLLDCDGVLADFTSTLLRYVSLAHPDCPKPEDVTQFDLKDFLTEEQHKTAVDILTTTRFAVDMLPMPRAQQIVRLLRNRGCEVYVLTAPFTECPTWEYDRRAWLARHFAMPEHRVVSTTAKYLVRGDIFVDDRSKHVRSWADAWPGGRAFLLTHPHNRDEQGLRRLDDGDGWTARAMGRLLEEVDRQPRREGPPPWLDEALNSGDGTYRP